MVDLLSWRLDFKADVHRGDRFRVLWEQRTTLEGRLLKPGPHRRGRVRGRSDSAAAYLLRRTATSRSTSTTAGHPLDGAPLRYPLEFTRITSAFSDARMHPILHATDRTSASTSPRPPGRRCAPSAPAVVQFSGVQSGFGNHIEIDHGDGFVSAYSHLQRIAPGIATGESGRRAASCIGWVGSDRPGHRPASPLRDLRGRRSTSIR